MRRAGGMIGLKRGYSLFSREPSLFCLPEFPVRFLRENCRKAHNTERSEAMRAAAVLQISLYFSLLAGNLGRRRVRTRLRRQPTSTVSTHRCRYQEKEAAFAGLFACTSQAPCSPFQKSKRNTARSLRQPFELFPNFGDALLHWPPEKRRQSMSAFAVAFGGKADIAAWGWNGR